MTLQRRKPGNRWVDVLNSGKVVKSPIDIEQLLLGTYRLLN